MRLSPLLLVPLLAACDAASPGTIPLAGAGPVAAATDETVGAAKAPGRYVETLKFGGKTRRYILRVPKAYRGRPVPVVMVLHGWTASAASAEQYTRMADKAEKEGFVAVFPDGLGDPGMQGWNAGFIDLSGAGKPDDVGFLGAVLDRVESEVSVDKSREYVVGHSNGAFMANLLGAKLGGRLAAIASMAGTVGLSAANAIPKPVAPVSVLLLHGKADGMVAYSVERRAVLRPIGAVDSAKFWAKADGCDPTPRTTKSADGKVVVDRYAGGKRGTEVELVSVEGAPHDWWGGLSRRGDQTVEVPAYGAPVADLVWDFFLRHPKR